MSSRRVAITGLGVICALGHGREDFWRSVVECRPGIGPLTLVDPALLRMKNGAEVRDYRWQEHFEPREEAQLDRFAQFALVAADEAVRMAGIQWDHRLRQRTLIVTGTSVGGQGTVDEGYRALYREGNPRVNPLTIPRTMANAAASQISLRYGITGPAWTVSTACSSSSHAIGQAFWMVRSGACELALAGGSESPFHYGFLKAWDALRVVAPDTCRPFSKDRAGMILGEGAAILVLEDWDHASARGAEVVGEICGFGMSSDAHHITQPHPEGAALALAAALEDAGITPEQVGYINAHGTGTAANDPAETRAIRLVFGSNAERLVVSSTKSLHGHALGAAGAIEAAATVLALERGILPPTANFTEPDPDCDLDVAPNAARPVQVEYALSNSFAFGGLNAVLVFRAAHTG